MSTQTESDTDPALLESFKAFAERVYFNQAKTNQFVDHQRIDLGIKTYLKYQNQIDDDDIIEVMMDLFKLAEHPENYNLCHRDLRCAWYFVLGMEHEKEK
jgi:hypothetical protein